MTNASDILCAWQSQAVEAEALSLAATKLPALEALSYHSNEMILDVGITSVKGIYAIQCLKLDKAVGDDGLSAEHLHYGKDCLVHASGKSFQFKSCS